MTGQDALPIAEAGARWVCLAFVVALALVAGLPLWMDWFHHAQWVRETSSMHPGNAAPVAWLGWPAWAAGSAAIFYALHHMRLPISLFKQSEGTCHSILK